MFKLVMVLMLGLLLALPSQGRVAAADMLNMSELVIADQGASNAVIVVAPDAGPWERRAATDLVKYIALMAGPQLPVVTRTDSTRPSIFVGRSALAADPGTMRALQRLTNANSVVRDDAIIIRRSGNRLFVAGSNDESHYFAVSWLLQSWGCRWYMPTEFGEVVPKRDKLSVNSLDFQYSPPFEIRRYWISWNGDPTGAEDFQRRNFMSSATIPGYGHALDAYTADIAPPGKTHFNVPFADPLTAEHVSARIESDYAAGKDISLAIADGTYENDHPADRALVGEYDPYFLKPSMTDAMMTLYNSVGRRLRTKYPESPSKIGGLAYVNVTLPPRQVTSIEPNIVMWLAPIDIDPNHAMDDPRSPPRLAYRGIMERWSKLLPGRLAIYDYDQGMLVWRDLPNPSHSVFAKDVKIYRQAGILGVQTESRGAFATTFLNLFFRGQLMWNPDADVPAILAEFYSGFYGPAAVPMSRYWNRIFDAWERTQVTEHEHFIIPAIYTPALVEALRTEILAAEAIIGNSREDNEQAAMFVERLRFTRASFAMIDTYVTTALAAARDADYVAATNAGNKALVAHRSLRAMNPLFVSGIVGGEHGTAWLTGEVHQYAEIKALTDGTRGSLVQRLPLEWSFKLEKATGSESRYHGPEGPKPAGNSLLSHEQPTAANGWRTARTDSYLQAQGFGQGNLGHYWYTTAVNLKPRDPTKNLHIMMPGLFNEAWLYINGKLVAHRNYKEPWWLSDYRFEWDVDITSYVQPGLNQVALRGFNPHHFAGMFRRPFLYEPRYQSTK